jgi:glucose/arabinose dehydrogenase
MFQRLRRSRFLIFWLLALSVGMARADLVRVPNTTLTLPDELPVATGFVTSNALGDLTFDLPLCTTFPKGVTNRLWVMERAGVVKVVDNLGETPISQVFMNLSSHLTAQGRPLQLWSDNGLLAMAFHPNYNQNGFFFLYYAIQVNGQLYQRVARFKATGTAGNYNTATSANPATETPLLTMHDRAGNHNGCDMDFGPDGYLYISLGDEGYGTDERDQARYINKGFWGHVLRLDVDNNPANLPPNPHTQPSAEFPSAIHAGTYRVPADNPFIGGTSWHGEPVQPNKVRTEAFATGFRSPFRFTIDQPTGRIFLGDVGEATYEEVNEVVKGGDYGWSWREGMHDFEGEPEPTEPPPGYENFRKDPIFEYDHTDDGVGNDAVITGTTVCSGLVYRGNQFPELQGKLLIAEIFRGGGIIAALTETSPGVWSGERVALQPEVVDFGIDPRNGEPLLCSMQGTIYKLSRTGTTGTPPPATLSATGAFADLTTLAPNDGIVPYAPNVDFWSDHAKKSRWFSIKNTTDTMTWSATGHWTFPVGMVWIKHFDFETTRGNPATRRKLETRFLVKTATGIYGLSYRWRADQTDADLVEENGFTEVIPSSSPAQTWRYPSRGECMSCHTKVAGHALSFNTPQMNREHDYGGDALNQIMALSGAGYFSDPATDVASQPAFARADDLTESLEWRVRSYLAANCVQCHQPGGAARGLWDARHTTPLDSANLINGLLMHSGGDSANRFMVPNDPGHSMVLKRQQGNGVPRMPPLATSERDLAAEKLITKWIYSTGAPQPGVIAINLPPGSTINVLEDAGQVQIPIVRTQGYQGEVGFSIATTDGSAIEGSDFEAPTDEPTLGEEEDILLVPITILDPPDTGETNETFTVTLTAPTGGATLGAVKSVTVRIIDSVDDAAPPVPVISSPAAGFLVGRNPGGTLQVTGTAKDDKSVGSVRVKVNNDPFVVATLTAAGTPSTGWTAAVVPAGGVNTITVQSYDSGDNPSPPVTRSVSVMRPLVVHAASNLSSLSSGFMPPSFREIGKSCTITATPKAGAIFNGWTLGGEDVAIGEDVDFTPQRIGVPLSALEKQTLTFIFREGLVLTANFIASPYTPEVTGTYHGLIKTSGSLPDRGPVGASPGDGTVRSVSTEGLFTATVSNSGAFSGKLMIDGMALNVAGAFDALGRARFGTARAFTQTVARPNKPSLSVKFDIGGPTGSAAPTGKITGQVSATAFQKSIVSAVSHIEADRAYFTGLTGARTVPDEYLTVTGTAASPTGRTDGMYTMMIGSIPVGSQPPWITDSLEETDYPQGDGVGTMKVTKSGGVTLAGTLADGTPITASAKLSEGLEMALFAQLYKMKGYFSAKMRLDSGIWDSDVKAPQGAEVLWTRPFMDTAHYYPFGWEGLDVYFVGAKYVATAGESVMRTPDGGYLQAVDDDGNVMLTFSRGQLIDPLVKSANLSKSDLVTKIPDNDPTFTMVINRATGAITGVLDHTDDTKPAYNAIIYQKGPNAGARGYFLTKQPVPIDYTGESGKVEVIGQP